MISLKELKELSSTLNILYAEDEAILRDSMQSILEKLFKNVYTAKNGQEAIELYKHESIDLVLTDINMPIMDGVELISAINKLESNPTIIVLSAHDESRLLKTLINMEVNNFLNKPVEKDALIRILYKNCSILNDKKMIKEYASSLEQENDEILRKNKLLEFKLQQLVSQTNKVKTKTLKGVFTKEKEAPVSNVSYYNTLLQDDRDELKDLADELDKNILLMFQNKSLNLSYIQKLSNLYKKYASVLSSYNEFYTISHTLTNFADIITTLDQKFLENVEQTGIYFESLQLTFESFRKSTWEKEAKDPYFHNASLSNDIELIIDYLEGKEAEDNEIEFF